MVLVWGGMIIRSFKRIIRIIRYPRFDDEAMRMSILYVDIYAFFRNKSIINLLGFRIFILISSFIFKLLTI